MKRITEREIVYALMTQLDLPFLCNFETPSNVIRIAFTPDEWERIRKWMSLRGVDEICEAWRQLPPAVWQNEHWAKRICMRVCTYAKDCKNLVPGAAKMCY